MTASTYLHKIPDQSPFAEDEQATSRIWIFANDLGYHPTAVYLRHRFQLLDAGARTATFEVMGPGDSWYTVSSGHVNNEVVEYEGPTRGFRFTMSATGSGANVAVVSYPVAT